MEIAMGGCALSITGGFKNRLEKHLLGMMYAG